MDKLQDEELYKQSLGKRKITDFDAKVYEACKRIPRGKVTSYAALAFAINAPKACRAVGTSLKKNPFAPTVPCHRVVSSNLTLGGFRGSKGDVTLTCKYDMLIEEGVKFEGIDQPKKLSSSAKVDKSSFFDFDMKKKK